MLAYVLKPEGIRNMELKVASLCPLDPARLSREYMKPALKKAGVTKPFRPFHDLRHTLVHRR